MATAPVTDAERLPESWGPRSLGPLAAGRVADVDRELAGPVPRGWPAGGGRRRADQAHEPRAAVGGAVRSAQISFRSAVNSLGVSPVLLVLLGSKSNRVVSEPEQG